MLPCPKTSFTADISAPASNDKTRLENSIIAMFGKEEAIGKISKLRDAILTYCILYDTKQNDVDIDPVKVEEYTAILESSIDLDSIAGTYCGVFSYIQ